MAKFDFIPSVSVGSVSALAVAIGSACASSSISWLGGLGVGALAGIGIGGLFFAAGLREVALGHRALPLWFGTRQLTPCFGEGLCWYWPKPLGNIEPVDCRRKELVIAKEAVILSHDGIKLTISAFLTYKTGPEPQRLYDYLEAENPENILKLAAEAMLKDIVSSIPAEHAYLSKEGVAAYIKSGKGKMKKKSQDGLGSEEYEQIAAESLQEKVEPLGFSILSVEVTEVRLPQEIEAANAKKLKEEAEREAERTERDGNIAAIKAYTEAGLSPEAAAIAHEVQQGKANRDVKTVQGIDLAGLGNAVGSAIGAAINKGDK